MPEVKVDVDNTGMSLMRSVGRQLRVMPAKIDFSDVTSYPADDVDVDFDSFFTAETITVVIPPKNDYILEYDEENGKVIVQGAAEDDDVSDIGEARCIVYGY